MSGTASQPTEDERSIAEIATELGSLAAEIAAQTCRFLHVLGEFDARQGWQDVAGMRSCVHWLSWRCGMSGSTAREHVRIARALRTLPLVETEFAAGQLSYSKVRAITRVGTAANEDELVQAAQAASADQLDRLCAGIRTGASLADINARHSRRRLSYRIDEDGSVSFSAHSSPEEGAVIVEALCCAQDYLERTADGNRKDTEHSLLDALVLVCAQSAVSSEIGGGRPGEDHVWAGRRSETVLHATLDDLAAAVHDSAEDAEDAEDAPPGYIGPHLELGPSLHPETARRLTCDTGVVLHLHENAPAGALRRPLVTPSARPGRTIDLGRRRRTPNAALLRALWDRDQCCIFPGCARRRYLHVHHIQHWARGGPTTLGNLAMLCGEHHRAHHEGGFELQRGIDGVLHTYGPDGAVVEPVPPAKASPAGEKPAQSAAGDVLTATDARPFNLGYAVSTLLGNRRIRADTDEPHAA